MEHLSREFLPGAKNELDLLPAGSFANQKQDFGEFFHTLALPRALKFCGTFDGVGRGCKKGKAHRCPWVYITIAGLSS